MADQTPRLNLDTFAQGDENWSHTDTVEALDERAIVHGPIADRPASGTYDDELYHATDQDIIWRWDAAAEDWQYFAGKGSAAQRVTGTSYLTGLDVADAPTADTEALRKLELDNHTAVNNPHGTGLEDVRSEDNLVAGDVDMGGNSLQDIAALLASGATISVDAPIDGQSPGAETHLTTKGYVDSVAQGLDWQESVLEQRNDPPADPTDGDRYLVGSAPTGDWSANPDEIAEWGGDATAWEFFAPGEGWAVFVEDANVLETFVDGGWIDFGSAIDHGALNGLSDDDHEQYLHVDGRRPLTGPLDADDNEFENVGAVSETENVVADAGASYDIDLSNGGVHKITLTQNCDITLSGVDAAASNSATLVVEQDGTGGHSLTFSTTVLWPNGNPPTVSDGAGEIDRLAFTYIDGDWLGSEAGAGFQ